MSAPLKNYTSEVAVSVTIGRITNLLVQAGARQIGMDYNDAGEITGIMFSLQLMPDRPPVPIKFPANSEAAVDSLWADYAGSEITPHGTLKYGSRKNKSRVDFIEQGKRTAWKIMQDWLEVQVSMIKLRQVDPMQAFLPYAWDGKMSFYHRIKERGFAALMPPKEP